MITLIVILGALAFLIVVGIFLYNSLVRKQNRVEEAWSDIDVQLKRRSNLIPNLVETVKGYAKHEREVFENVTKARSEALQASGRQERQESENMLSDALKSLFAVSEDYPDLKASDNFLELQKELRDTEDKIQAARRFYNSNVRDYNTSIESVPTNIVANMFGFKQEQLFEVETEAEKEKPEVNF